MKAISVIIPMLNEQKNIQILLKKLQLLRDSGAELIVVDGGSSDSSCELAVPLSDYLVHAKRGRAVQMNAGVGVANGKLLWFLHADIIPSDYAIARLQEIANNDDIIWGRFDVRLSGRHLLLKVVETMMNLRSRLTGIATGDQGIFMHRKLFEEVNGFPDIPLMEDVSISSALKKIERPLCLSESLSASSRRWKKKGILRTIFLMWWVRFAFALGWDPARLYKQYYG